MGVAKRLSRMIPYKEFQFTTIVDITKTNFQHWENTQSNVHIFEILLVVHAVLDKLDSRSF